MRLVCAKNILYYLFTSNHMISWYVFRNFFCVSLSFSATSAPSLAYPVKHWSTAALPNHPNWRWLQTWQIWHKQRWRRMSAGAATGPDAASGPPARHWKLQSRVQKMSMRRRQWSLLFHISGKSYGCSPTQFQQWLRYNSSPRWIGQVHLWPRNAHAVEFIIV